MRYQKPRINVRPSFHVYTSYQDLCAIEKLQGRYELAITSMMNLTFSLSLSLSPRSKQLRDTILVSERLCRRQIPSLSPCNSFLQNVRKFDVTQRGEGGCDTCQVSAVMKLEEARGEARPSSS